MENLGAQDPRWIGEYQLLGRLGEGGMGKVYLARSSRGRTVAVKLVQAELARQSDFRGRFKREVEAARRVGGQWTAPVLDADTEAAVPWVATGYIGGPSLHEVVAEDFGALPEQSVRVLAHGLSLALRDIHGAGLIHRDFKPSNILITIDGPRVIDFGIARALDAVGGGNSNLTATGAVVGSPGFMSPEQVRGETVTTASDVFCLGSVLAFAATGRQPFGRVDSGIHALMYRIAQEEPDLEGLPEGLLGLVTACLSKDPAQRPSVPDLIAYTEAAAPDPAEPWLPGGLLARLGRDALQLLEAENPHQQAPAPAPTPPQSGYATPSAGGPAAAGGPATPNPPSAYGVPSAPAAYGYPVGGAWPQQGGGYQPPAGPPDQGRKVRSVRALGNSLVTVFVLWMLLTISDLYLRMSQFGALRDLAEDEGSAAAVDRRAEAVASLDGALGMCVVTLVILWLVWFRRTYVNATALSPGRLRFGSGYAVGAWFIPIALLWIPKQIANDIWTASARPGPGRVPRAALHWWWTGFVLMCFSAPSAGILEVAADGSRSLDERVGVAGHIADDGISLLTAVLAITVVVKLTGMQERRRAAQRQQQQTPVPAGVFGPPVT
ncbi:protein kinase domain-containing protein [Streptomyces sp. BRA346]|uniref:protein kinase domain-containing protein n=1 Tax=Streptomyces sp. BRA346 TaxID=2878199 RepID=UPI0040628C7F